MLLFTATNVKLVILVCYLVVIVFIIFFSWLYLTRTLRASREIGVQAPGYIKILVRVSIINAIATAVLISFFLLMNIY
ncbi:MAG: hypothetical protein ACR2LN_00700 [Candidatus Levyibacteriota bacterium]